VVDVTYFSSRDIAAVAVCAALWGMLNVTISPVFWTLTRLPFACDLIGFTCLAIAVRWSRRVGTATLVGIIATIINLLLRPSAPHFIGFTAASIVYDVLARLIGYRRLFSRPIGSVLGIIVISVVSGGVAGFIIGWLFMDPVVIANVYGTPFLFAGFHAFGGALGGFLGVLIIQAIQLRGVFPQLSEPITRIGG
jgi:hypothetical protein